MRRVLAAANPVRLAAASASTASQQRTHTHGNSHSHGGSHHHHSHAAIEKEIEGDNLRQCQLATLAGGATNVFFCATKLWFGSSGGSVALVADGFHALTDIVADVVSYASISLAKKKLPRCRFPFGIGRLETSGAVFVAAILLIGGIMLLLQSSQSCLEDMGHFLSASTAITAATATVASSSGRGSAAELQDGHHHDHGDHHGHSHGGGEHHGHSHFEVTKIDEASGERVVLWTMVVIAASSVICKELLFHWTRRVGKKAGSRVVVANAYHHRADAWSGAAALVGVAGKMMGIPGADGIAGLVVSLSICKIGYSLFRDSVLEFFDYQNAEEVAQVREKLQDFHLRVRYDGVISAERNADSVSGSSSNADSGALATRAPAVAVSTGLQESNIRYINVFLMRHGHSYALHVQLLIHESQTATQIQEATEQLEKLAKASLPVHETFISVLVCSPKTVSREEFYHRLYKETFCVSPGASDVDGGADEDGHDHDHGRSPALAASGPSDTDAHEMFIAAQGELVNPSLEKCLRSLSDFHGFTKPIRYSWESRTVTTPKDSSCECSRDVESVAKIFKCSLVEAEGNDREECHGHTHSHSHTTRDSATSKKTL